MFANDRRDGPLLVLVCAECACGDSGHWELLALLLGSICF